MKKIIFVVILLVLALQNSVSNQTRNANSQTSQSSSEAAKRKGKVLVKRLPGGLEGVELKSGAVAAKPGYKFVKQENGTFAVARIKPGGGNVSGTWDCGCDTKGGGTPGTCSAIITGTKILCIAGTCGSCTLITTIEGLKTRVIAY